LKFDTVMPQWLKDRTLTQPPSMSADCRLLD